MQHVPQLSLGGWANPHADAVQQVEYLRDHRFTGEFFLTQIVSHHDIAAVERFLSKSQDQKVDLPGVFGVFYYRSAQPKTLATLRRFLPVPVEGLTREFGEGLSPEEICARTIRMLRAAGVRHFYISNLPVGRARATMEKVVALSEEGHRP